VSAPGADGGPPVEGVDVPWWRTRTAVLGAGAGFLVVVAVVAGVVATRGDAADGSDAADGPAASASSSPSPTSTAGTAVPGPSPEGPASEPAVDPGAADPSEPADPAPYSPQTEPGVALDAPADFGTGVVARIASVTAVEGVAQGPGESGGPSLRVELTLTNSTGSAISLDTTVVDLYFGADQTPGLLLSGSGETLFSGSLDDGASASATYVFKVPVDQRDRVQVTVSYTRGEPTVLFEGTAPAA
jgi:hypothetical protein